MCAQKSLQQKRNPSADAVKQAMAQPPLSAAKIATRHETFEGPLPHPEILKQYDIAVPGLAERVVAMAEKEQEARLDIAREEVKQKTRLIEIAEEARKDNSKAMTRGQVIGLAISAACVVCAAVFAAVTKDWPIPAVFLAVPTGSFIASFMPRFKDSKNKSESETK